MDARRDSGEDAGPRRLDAAQRGLYEELCEEALDYYESGDAQRRHLRAHLIHRYGTQAEPRKAASASTDTTTELSDAETDDARTIREGRLELITAPLVPSIVDSVSVLYSADDLERKYRAAPDKATEDEHAKRVIGHYHREARLPPTLQSVDAYVSILHACCLLLRWCAPRRRIAYSVVWPHLVRVLDHPEWPLDPGLAYAIAYREAGTVDGAPIWSCYVRGPLSIDPDDAPTHAFPKGRLVRFARKGAPFPLPEAGSGSGAILSDGPNPLIGIGGMAEGRLLWCPLVWHHARPPVETLFPAPASDLVGASREVDLALSWLQYLANTQSHGQAVMVGPGKVRRLGPGSIVRVDDPSGSFTFHAPGADIAGILESAQRQIQIQALLRHLSPDMYSLTRPSIQTGPAKLLEQAALVEARWRRTLVADGWEADRFDLERLLHNAYGRPTGFAAISWKTRQIVRWGELRVPVDRAAQVTRLLAEIGAALTSRTDAAMEIYGLPREEATEHLRRVDEEAAPKQAPKPAEAGASAAPGAPNAPEAKPPDAAAPSASAPAASTPGGERAPAPSTEPAKGPPKGDEGDAMAMSKAERESLAFVASMFETMVKAKSPPEVTRALVLQMAEKLGVADDAVKTAIGDASFEWYTTPAPTVEAGAGDEEQ